MADKTWYAARLLYVSERSGSEDDRLCEESIVLVEAADEAAAVRAAEEVGRAESGVTYRNEDGELIEWRFLGLIELQDLCESRVESGAEVYSRLFFESQATDDDIRNRLGAQADRHAVHPRS